MPFGINSSASVLADIPSGTQMLTATTKLFRTSAIYNFSEIFDSLSGWDKNKFIRLIEKYGRDVEKATRVKFVEYPGIYAPTLSWLSDTRADANSEKIKSAHPEI